MTHLIDKDALVAEMEKLIDEIYAGQPFDSLSREQQVALWYVKSIMSSIATLEVKEVDLGKEVDDVMKRFLGNITCREEQLKFARHFFELGLKAQKGEEV